MRILADQRIRALFSRIGICIGVFISLSAVMSISLGAKAQLLGIFLTSLCTAAAILTFCSIYFREQDKILEDAAAQIKDYIAGDLDARIACDGEGELYHLFHQINSLAAILNAQAENELRSKEFLKGTIADISHQLKTPLAALNIYNGILQGEADGLPVIQEFTSLSEQELDRIETLVQSLLKITKLDAGTILLNKTQEDIADIMGNIRQHFSFRIRQEQKEIHLEGDAACIFACDRIWLTEVLENIVKNALDHTQAGDSIQIKWRRLVSMLQITVRDNGSGIHPEDLYHIFKRFYRSRFSKDTKGIGLGLPLAKSIIEMHGGTVGVDSEWGRGTVFVINFLIPTKL